MNKIGVIDYSAGNLSSIFNALDACDLSWKRISSLEDFNDFSHLILPGVGAFKHGMDQLKAKGFVGKIEQEVQKGTPFLGICLGMQLLFEKSYEFGEHDGLGIIKGKVLPINEICGKLAVPHMGWNDVVSVKKSKLISSALFSTYFLQSYYCECSNNEDVLGLTEYGEMFCSAIERENIFGVQFHPEKSHKDGLSILKNFGSLSC